MSDKAPKVTEQRPANLAALHRELQEIAARRRCSSQSPKERLERAQGPVLVIRGK